MADNSQIKLSSKHALALSKLLDKFNLELDVITTTEGGATKPNTITMSSNEIEAMIHGNAPVVVKVDQSILDSIPDIIVEYKESAKWYRQINKAVLDVLSESDGTLLLGMIAVFSAKTFFGSNVDYAIEAYVAVKDDIENNTKLLLEFFNFLDNENIIAPKDRKSIKKVLIAFKKQNKYTQFNTLEFHKYFVDRGTLDSHLYATNRLCRYYIQNNGKISPKSLAKLIANSLELTGDISKDPKNITSGYKILNFTLNLLQPDMVIDVDGKAEWSPVTVDSWMIYFFYPDSYKLVNAEKQSFKGKIFSSYKKYTYLGKIVQEHAEKFGLKPYELQSIIWISIMKKLKPNSTANTFGNVLEIKKEKLKKKNRESSDVYKLVEKLRSAL